LWYVTDEVGRISRPVKELVHFERIELQPGETKEVTLAINPKEQLGYPDFNGESILEDGYFTIHVGTEKARFYLDRSSD